MQQNKRHFWQKKSSFVRLGLIFVLIMGFTALPTPALAASVSLHIHGGPGLTFHFYFQDTNNNPIPEIVVTGGNNSVATPLAVGDRLDHVDVYSGVNLVETLSSTDVLHRSSNTAHLTSDGSILNLTTYDLEKNNGTLNFWYRGGAQNNGSYSTQLSLYAQKTLSGALLADAAGLFSFTATDNTTHTVYSGSNDAAGNINFAAITYSEADIGQHTYTIRETTSTLAGWTTDTNVYQVTVNVSWDTSTGVTILLALPNYPGDAGIVFANSYQDPPGTGRVWLQAQKTVTGASLVEGEFEFVVRDAHGEEVCRATNDADGNINFPAIYYDEALGQTGTFEYTIAEVGLTSGDATGWTLDSNSYAVSVVVTTNHTGTLDVTASYPADGVVFQNAYSALDPYTDDPPVGDPPADDPSDPPTTPATGDNSSLGALTLVGCLLIAGGLLAAVAARPSKRQPGVTAPRG
ncbi:MAG: hypothetical protein FWC59_02220 [Actinomycetia bacterium]|nr:hypothetical protein [Actinomycetes bacterium]